MSNSILICNVKDWSKCSWSLKFSETQCLFWLLSSSLSGSHPSYPLFLYWFINLSILSTVLFLNHKFFHTTLPPHNSDPNLSTKKLLSFKVFIIWVQFDCTIPSIFLTLDSVVTRVPLNSSIWFVLDLEWLIFSLWKLYTDLLVLSSENIDKILVSTSVYHFWNLICLYDSSEANN